MSHNRLAVGVDAGGTATRAVLATASGESIGFGRGGRGNPTSSGIESAGDGVMTAVRAALAAGGRTLSDVSVIVMAMAGQRTEAGSDWLLARLGAEGFAGRLVFESDLLATYVSGAAEDAGYAVVAGTGACAIRVRGGRVDATGDGLGWLLGDRGAGFWIGRQIARAVVRDLDGAGSATALTAAVLDQLGIVEEAGAGQGETGRRRVLERLVERLYAAPPIELAALAPLAFAVDDRVAARILHRAGTHLADTLSGVLSGPGPVVIGGSILNRRGPVRDAFTECLGTIGAFELRPVADGTVGAGALALRACGVPVTAALVSRLHDSLARLR